MRLLEHQSKWMLSRCGIPLSKSTPVDSVTDAMAVAHQVGFPVVLKAQVPFGGRGKAGAVKFAANADEVRKAATELFQLELRGFKVETISIESKLQFSNEYYLGIAWDIPAKLPVAIMSSVGGVEVEQSRSDQVLRQAFDPWNGLDRAAGEKMAEQLKLTKPVAAQLGQILSQLSQAFLSFDAILVELNPVVMLNDGSLIALDARMEIDDDAAFRQKMQLGPQVEFSSSATGRVPTVLELEAQRIDAMDHRGVAGRVVEFDGDMALLIGGGGASLTVFDAVRRYGGKPANYCEVGGNPTEEKVAALTTLLLGKHGVRKLAVIMNVVNNTRADVMARGVIQGIERAGRVPSETINVFRVPGSWEQEARDILASAGVRALGRDTSLDAAARQAVESMNGQTIQKSNH